MKQSIPAFVLLTIALISGVSASAAEKKITRAQLPAEVAKTADTLAKDASVRGYSLETESGSAYYEVEMIAGGHHKDVLIDSKGAVVEIEEEVALNSLSAEVQTSLKNKAAGRAIKSVESVTKHDKLVAYEAQILAKGKKSEIQVGPDGNALPHEE